MESAMKNIFACSLAAALLVPFPAFSVTYADTNSTIPDTPAGKRIKESIEVIDSGDLARMQDYAYIDTLKTVCVI